METRSALCWLDPTTRTDCGWAGKTSSSITLNGDAVAENKLLVLNYLLLLIRSFLEGRVL